MFVFEQFLRQHWPEAILLLLLLLILPPFLNAMAGIYNAGANVIRAIGGLFRVPQETINKVIETLGNVIGKPLAAVNTALEANPALKIGVVAALFVLRPIIGVFVGLWYLKDWLFDRPAEIGDGGTITVLPEADFAGKTQFERFFE